MFVIFNVLMTFTLAIIYYSFSIIHHICKKEFWILWKLFGSNNILKGKIINKRFCFQSILINSCFLIWLLMKTKTFKKYFSRWYFSDEWSDIVLFLQETTCWNTCFVHMGLLLITLVKNSSLKMKLLSRDECRLCGLTKDFMSNFGRRRDLYQY